MRCWRLVTAVLVVLGLGVPAANAESGGNPGGGRGFDPASSSENNHCYTSTGRDWNEILGVSEQVLARGCSVVNSGEFFVTPNPGWIVNTTFDSYPDWFTPPAGKTPAEDFFDKVGSVKYVIDTGTRRERSYVFTSPIEAAVPLGELGAPPGWEDFPLVIVFGKMRPLPVGDHTFQSFLTMDGDHCDGIADVTEENCLLAGETYPFSPVRPFTVEPGAAQGG